MRVMDRPGHRSVSGSFGPNSTNLNETDMLTSIPSVCTSGLLGWRVGRVSVLTGGLAQFRFEKKKCSKSNPKKTQNKKKLYNDSGTKSQTLNKRLKVYNFQ